MPKDNIFMLPQPSRHPALLGPADLLQHAVPALQDAEQLVAKLRAFVAAQGRDLAKERGVAFIREERLRAEFTAKKENGHGDRA